MTLIDDDSYFSGNIPAHDKDVRNMEEEEKGDSFLWYVVVTQKCGTTV
jgi:hypothetical protein